MATPIQANRLTISPKLQQLSHGSLALVADLLGAVLLAAKVILDSPNKIPAVEDLYENSLTIFEYLDNQEEALEAPGSGDFGFPSRVLFSENPSFLLPKGNQFLKNRGPDPIGYFFDASVWDALHHSYHHNKDPSYIGHKFQNRASSPGSLQGIVSLFSPFKKVTIKNKNVRWGTSPNFVRTPFFLYLRPSL